MARVIGLKQLSQKKYVLLEGLPEAILKSFGELTASFILIVWGLSGNGKSNFLMQFLKCLMPWGKILYVSYEEGTEATMQKLALRHLDVEEHSGKIEFADHTMTYDELVKKLRKKKSPQFIVIDSLQYFGINYAAYKRLKEMFPRKAFLFISHATGKMPSGKTAIDIRYDAGIKIRIEGYLAFISSRYGGNEAYVIWEQGAKEYWGKNFKKMIKKRL